MVQKMKYKKVKIKIKRRSKSIFQKDVYVSKTAADFQKIHLAYGTAFLVELVDFQICSTFAVR